MNAAAKARGIVHRVGTNMRWSERGAVTRYALKEGMVGEPIYALLQREISLLAASGGLEAPDWWKSVESGAGWLLNGGTHKLDLIHFSMGEIAELSATLYKSDDRPENLEDSFTLQFRFQIGLEGVLATTARAWSPRYCERIVGTKDTLTIENGVVFISDKAGTRPVSVPPELARPPIFQDLSFVGVEGRYQATHMKYFDVSTYVVQADEFGSAIEGRGFALRELAADFDDGVAHMLLVDAVRESARTHLPIRMCPAS